MPIIPNVSGISYINIQKQQLMPGVKGRRRPGIMPVGVTKRKAISKKSAYIQDVDMLVANNEKAFLYDNGKVDITKDTGIRTITFPSKKAAALYLMKAGWQYV